MGQDAVVGCAAECLGFAVRRPCSSATCPHSSRTTQAQRIAGTQCICTVAPLMTMKHLAPRREPRRHVRIQMLEYQMVLQGARAGAAERLCGSNTSPAHNLAIAQFATTATCGSAQSWTSANGVSCPRSPPRRASSVAPRAGNPVLEDEVKSAPRRDVVWTLPEHRDVRARPARRNLQHLRRRLRRRASALICPRVCEASAMVKRAAGGAHRSRMAPGGRSPPLDRQEQLRSVEHAVMVSLAATRRCIAIGRAAGWPFSRAVSADARVEHLHIVVVPAERAQGACPSVACVGLVRPARAGSSPPARRANLCPRCLPLSAQCA